MWHCAAACSVVLLQDLLHHICPVQAWCSAELGQTKPGAPAWLLTQQQSCSGGAVLTARCLQLTAPLPHAIATLPSFLLPFSGPEQSSKEEPHLPLLLPLC